jgi:nicotinate-nucleotide pyrophosphorylase (carboxylating)
MSLLESALLEDSWKNDLCTRFCVSEFSLDAQAKLIFEIISRVPGCFSGEQIVDELAKLENNSFKILKSLKDGQVFHAQEVLVQAEGPLELVLSLERSFLNLLQHSCAISTLTKELVDKIHERAKALSIPSPQLLHTRKTIPGLKDFQIKAVVAGGGKLHRRDLSSGHLFKENHKYLCKQMGVSFEDLVGRCVQALGPSGFQVEVENEKELELVLSLRAKKILLDNFSPEKIKNILPLKEQDVEIEVSGGLTPSNIESYVLPGVSRLSLGFLTHSVKALDLGLDWKFLK